DSAPLAPARAEEGLQRVAAEIRVDRDRVRNRLLALEVGRGVGPRRRADVPALRVGEDEEAGRVCVLAGFLEGTQTVGAERLEEGELRLDGDRVRRDRVDDPAAEARDRIGGGAPRDVGVSAQLHGEQVKPWVEA